MITESRQDFESNSDRSVENQAHLRRMHEQWGLALANLFFSRRRGALGIDLDETLTGESPGQGILARIGRNDLAQARTIIIHLAFPGAFSPSRFLSKDVVM